MQVISLQDINFTSESIYYLLRSARVFGQRRGLGLLKGSEREPENGAIIRLGEINIFKYREGFELVWIFMQSLAWIQKAATDSTLPELRPLSVKYALVRLDDHELITRDERGAVRQMVDAKEFVRKEKKQA